MSEEYLTIADGLVVADSTWTYKIPTIDTIPRHFNVEVLNSGHHEKRVLSSKASGELPLLLAASVHCAKRAAIKEARKQYHGWSRNEQVTSVHTIIQHVEQDRWLELMICCCHTSDFGGMLLAPC
ncbi:indole-3-acetaldehyde oxidase-like [Heracleum sosnowskyi]|uniref:Indole-3-acetaldehyde oxidase-like n=1 Tax=Heracleum sosnowskyi TaxID=360622 RepID=A0AAD8HGZ9_9APIA|nr:indole-3-acetaldehyde oxidase-like [Heracleum sosnowskyi]